MEKLKEESQRNREEAIKESQQLSDEFNAQKIQVNQLYYSIDSLKKQLNNAIKSIQQQLIEQTPKYEQQKKLQDDINKRRMEVDKRIKVELKQSIDKALQISDRVEVPEKENQTSLTNKIIGFKKELERQSQGKRSRQEALSLFTENNTKLKEICEQKANIEQLAKLLERNLNTRYIQWQRFRLSISRRSNQFFNIFLSKKGYTGTLTFNHKEGKLDINVNLDKKLNGNAAKPEDAKGGDTKGLSGGERSFSTVSLLLALWENMECPFRAMDEFDVFMDEVNRSISIKLLISKAEENKSKQYIFVTPLALNHLTSSANIRIHKVNPPIRGQATITESSTIVPITN
ncbi:hypothetical protein DICPUDRAFT_39295 [Dictyostelium purpureum]|uniref:RecF/RecN/SMC N-terminal domain-containing protein n=1 Tax=Dictyostelium purpureum TaxID=5786 RepID=F0ZW22_DICPU|nr:uncharacterized protein DICPUDRAFT_39295 [Dictyostelium purpureum]EGC31845.1 hypothetical protein DICPUDRAFT_39295 [Dictyostelium purpureum]|eukprot:XP_003291615.1 hypothetical protein DICPUDRAFT_39295 [Dictyostelium purpureum]